MLKRKIHKLTKRQKKFVTALFIYLFSPVMYTSPYITPFSTQWGESAFGAFSSITESTFRLLKKLSLISLIGSLGYGCLGV